MDVSLAVLVFLAASFGGGFVLISVWNTLQENAKKQDGEGVGIAPLRRFVSPVELLSRQFISAFACALVFPFLLWCKGVSAALLLIFVGIIAAVIGWRLPIFYYNKKVQARKSRFDGQILHLAMNLSNGLRSGMALPQALEGASSRMPDPMKEELLVVLRETRLGLDLPEAFERLYRRMPGEDLRLLLTSIRLSLQTGGSLAEILSRMVETIRARTEFQEKVKTMTAQGRFEAIAMSLAPLVVYILLKVIDPELMKPLTSTVVGWCAIGTVAFLLTIGFVIIRKIVTIDV